MEGSSVYREGTDQPPGKVELGLGDEPGMRRLSASADISDAPWDPGMTGSGRQAGQ